MVSLTIGAYDVSAKTTALKDSPKKIEDNSNSFTTADGITHRNILATKHSLDISLSNLTDTQRNAVISALSPDTVSVSYNSNSGTFYGDVVPSELAYSDDDGNHWDINFTLEEV